MTLKSEQFKIPSDLREGWGFTSDESSANENGYYTMYASDGSESIFIIDGETMKIKDSVMVTDQNHKFVSRINELEFVDGFIYANVWYTYRLLKINPATGQVVKEWDLYNLEQAEKNFQMKEKSRYKGDCLNGIAYDSNS